MSSGGSGGRKRAEGGRKLQDSQASPRSRSPKGNGRASTPPRNRSPKGAQRLPVAPLPQEDPQRGCICAIPWLGTLFGLPPDPTPPPSTPAQPRQKGWEDEPLGGQQTEEWNITNKYSPVATGAREETWGAGPSAAVDDYRPLSAENVVRKRPPDLSLGVAPPPPPPQPRIAFDINEQGLEAEPESPASSRSGDHSPRAFEDLDSTRLPSPAVPHPQVSIFAAKALDDTTGTPVDTLIENFKTAFGEGQKVVIHSKQLTPRRGLLFIENGDLCWNFFSAYYALKKGLRRMPLSAVLSVSPGKSGEAFLRKTADDVPENRCVTVTSADKALALQFQSAVVAEAFTMGLQLIVSHKTAKTPTSPSARLTPTAAP